MIRTFITGAVAVALAFTGCAPTAGPAPAGAPPVAALAAELEAIFDDPAFWNARWGVKVQSVETGEVLYERNAAKLFMPASNQKLVTGAVALARLGPDHRFHTRVAATGEVDATGVLRGDLVVIGGGDPAISGRFFGEDALAVFRAWADSLEAHGVRRIAGDLIGVDALYSNVHLGPGWAWDYLHAGYAAPFGALLYNEGTVRLRIFPADSAGRLARLLLDPPTGYLQVENRVLTGVDSTDLEMDVERRPWSNAVRVTGAVWVGADSVTRSVAVHDPTLFFVTVLGEVLEAEGIEIDGVRTGPAEPAVAAERAREVVHDTAPAVLDTTPAVLDTGPAVLDTTPAVLDTGPAVLDTTRTLFLHASPSLAEIVEPFLKESRNQIGEMLLHAVGAAETDTGAVETGRRVVRETLAEWGIPDGYYVYYDGSGLSRYNYLSPEAAVRLLRTVAHRPDFRVFYDALPIAGVDGTIERRMRGTRAEGNARAKTGYISNARTLSGYVRTADGELLAFSMMCNDFDVTVDAVEYLQDLAVERLAHFSRGAGEGRERPESGGPEGAPSGGI